MTQVARLVPSLFAIGRYRYSKLRWRVLVHAFDFLGTIVHGDRPAVHAGQAGR